MRRFTTLLLVLVAAFAAVAAGCGSDGESGLGPTPPPTPPPTGSTTPTGTTGTTATGPSAPEKKAIGALTPTSTTTVGTDGGSIAEHREQCAAGDDAACDRLYYETPVDSEDETFGATCGGRSETELDGRCEQTFSTGPGSFADLRRRCTDGDLASCDRLYYETPVDSEDEAFGATCGGRSETPLNGGCEEQLGGGTSTTDEIATHRGRCQEGDLGACDELYFETPVGSDDEAFGATCGERSTTPLNGRCEEDLNGGTTTTDTSASIAEHRQQCADGDLAACDELYHETPVDSEDETFGATCGGRSPDELNGRCEEDFDPSGRSLRDRCADGDNGACDRLYFVSPVDSDDETFGSTCGGRSREALLGRCEETLGATP